MDNMYELSILLLVLLLLAAVFFVLHQRLKRKARRHIQSNIQQLALLRGLIAGFQRHRGLSNALLCGDTSMVKELESTRQTLDQKISTAQSQHTTFRDAWNSLIDHWSRLREGHKNDPANNLKQHNLIIRHCIFLMEDVAGEIDLTQGQTELEYLSCIWHEVIQAAEWAGQARAMGTGIAAAGHSSAEQRVRMQFLYQKIEGLSGKAFATLQQHTTNNPQATAFRLQHSEQVVTNFLSCIKQELLGLESPKIAAKAYFQQATQSIDELLGLVDVALEHLQSRQQR